MVNVMHFMEQPVRPDTSPNAPLRSYLFGKFGGHAADVIYLHHWIIQHATFAPSESSACVGGSPKALEEDCDLS